MNNQSKAYLLGGGIGSLAAAAFMIRDGGCSGENIFILEAKPVIGGSLDGSGNPTEGYSLRGGRMLTTDNYECTWDLFKSIPSLTLPGKTVFDFISQFVEIPDDVVFTVEYSVRVAQMAVYQFLNIDKKIPPISPNDKSLKVEFEALIKAFK
jgi:myosin-crossreactive antigen